jgi:hypothetical protein
MPAALQAMLAGEVDVNVASVMTLVSVRLAEVDVVMLRKPIREISLMEYHR